MLYYRNYLLRTFGIEHNATAIMNADIRLQYDNEVKPFGEIVTDRNGRATLRVGQVLSKAPIVLVH